MSFELKPTLALFSWLILAGCSHHSASESLLVDPSAACAALKPLQLPSGLHLPPEDQHYQIPPKPSSIQRDHPIDIRPPIQLLALLPGSEARYHGKQATLQLEQNSDTRLLWQQLKQWLVQEGITTITQDDRRSVLVTDWIPVERVDGESEFRARYRLSLSSKKPPSLISELVTLTKRLDRLPQDQDPTSRSEALFQEITPTASEQRHYAIAIVNRLITDLAKPTPAANPPVQVTVPPKI